MTRVLPAWILSPQPPAATDEDDETVEIAKAALHVLDTAIDDEDPEFDIEQDLLPELGDDVTDEDVFAVIRRMNPNIPEARIEYLRTDACELAFELRRALYRNDQAATK